METMETMKTMKNENDAEKILSTFKTAFKVTQKSIYSQSNVLEIKKK